MGELKQKMNTPSNPSANEATTAEPIQPKIGIVKKGTVLLSDRCLLPYEQAETGDSWEAIEEQLQYWEDMDRMYWQQRKEQEYKRWLERTYNV